MSSNPYLELLFQVAMQKNKIVVPTDFHGQVVAIEEMLKNDSSGLVNTLLDFAIESASVKYEILTKSDKLNEILKNWLKNINKEFAGQIPKGIEELAKEYGRERWKGASFPILKIVGTTEIDGVTLPSKMYFVNGGAVNAEGKKGAGNSILKWDYFLGKKKTPESLLDEGVIITKPYSRWYDKYPVPYLVGRGVYHNWKLLQTLKGKQGEALEQIIPLLNLITKGDATLARDDKQTYDEGDLKQIKSDIQDLVEEVRKSLKVKSPTRVAPFDEKWEQIIPDLSKLFNINISASIERNILAGLGFIDVEEAVTASRRESILNPKAFIGEVKSGVDDFAKIIEYLIDIIIDLNEGSKKYNEALRNANVTHSAVEPFMTDRFRQEFRLLWKHGQVSNQTYAEVVGGVDFATEKMRREKEATEGTEVLMYPHLTQNTEQNQSPEELQRLKKLLDLENEEDEGDSGKTTTADGHYHTYSVDSDGEGKTATTVAVDGGDGAEHVHDIAEFEVQEAEGHTHGLIRTKRTQPQQTDKDVDKTGAPVTRDKVGDTKEFEFSQDLETAPYKNTKELPPRVKDNMTKDLQRVFVRVFNSAFNSYKDETRAFRVAWNVIRRIGRKDKNGKWVRKKKRQNGKLVKLKLNKAMVESVLDKEEKRAIEEATRDNRQQLKDENLRLRNLLLKSLTGKERKK